MKFEGARAARVKAICWRTHARRIARRSLWVDSFAQALASASGVRRHREARQAALTVGELPRQFAASRE